MTGVFRDFQRSNSPLSAYLAQRYTAPALDDIDAMTLDELGDPDAAVARIVADRRVASPAVGAGRSTGEGPGQHRPDETGSVSRPTIRHRVRYLVHGDIEALEWWPDRNTVDHGIHTDEARTAGEVDLPAVDDGVVYADRSTSGRGRAGADLQDYLARLEAQRWEVAAEDTPQRARGLHTFVEYPEADLDRIAAAELDIGAELAAQLARVRPIIDAIAEQHRRFFDTELPASLRTAIERRRRRLQGLQAARDSIGFPADWKDPEPQLAAPSGPTRSGEQAREDLALPDGVPSRFADVSFEQVLHTVRVWASAVEQHPAAYRELAEDRISDLLVVTLNTALPRAGREVYSRGGKTDIFIQADALPLGTGPEKVFIGENKKYSGPANASLALDQLMGYLQVRDTKALLLLLVDRKNFPRAYRDVLAELRARGDHDGEDTSPVAGWPLLRFRREESTAEVCLATVNVYAAPDHPDSRARAGSRRRAPK